MTLTLPQGEEGCVDEWAMLTKDNIDVQFPENRLANEHRSLLRNVGGVAFTRTLVKYAKCQGP
jgi:hypothetical protein